MARTKPETLLSPRDLRWNCPLSSVGRAGKARSVPGTVGQERALEALRVGLELYAPGYNVFVSGLTGTGRTTTVKRILEELSPRCAVPRDRCYVFNFDDPQCPMLLSLPAGKGVVLAREMDSLVRFLRDRVPALLEGADFEEKRREATAEFARKEKDLVQGFQERIEKEGFAVVQVPVGPLQRPAVYPLLDGKPVPEEEIERAVEEGRLPKKEGADVLERLEGVREELQDVLRGARDLARKAQDAVEELFRDCLRLLLEGHMADLKKTFREEPSILSFLKAVERDFIENTPPPGTAAGEGEGASEWREELEAVLARYTVNVLIDRSRYKGCPVVVENYPTFTNLFGTIEAGGPGRERRPPDHRSIVPGSLLRADGGYLLLSAKDLLSESGVWDHLKRALKSGRLEIQPPPEGFRFGQVTLKPRPVDIQVKVILIGDPGVYDFLYMNDSDFRKIFKVLADFDSSMPLTGENLAHFALVARRICEKEGLRTPDRSALAACAEFAVRDAGRRDRISTRFNEVADVLREADFHASREGGKRILGAHVRAAVEGRAARHRSLEDRVFRMLRENLILVSTEGKKVGQVNGLSVYQMGYHSFGKPTRITASTSAGGVGIINIEREARLSGGIYDKGVLIIAGWMRRVFAQERPLSLTASLSFEQSYSGVDGDSASVAEICALLSELSGIPIDQGFAVTGSVNQHGEIQPVGGVNEKIEGFFRLCSERGLTGNQGCVIPASNTEDLMLAPRVVEAVRAGKFQVHAAGNLDQVFRILMGVPAGERGVDGRFPEGTLFAAVAAKLEKYASEAGAAGGEMSPRLLAADREGEAARPGG